MHLQKITKTQAAKIADEIERSPEYMKYFDREKHEIKPELTHLNYDLVHSDLRITERLEKRLSEIKVMNRADVKHLGQWVITMPKDLDPALRTQFFEAVFDYFKDEYGEKNIIYATVHLDETTPHMHLGAVPVALNNKGQEHLSAKKVFNREHLQKAHAECQEFCERRLGREVNILNGESLGVEGVQEYKKAKEMAKDIALMEARKETLTHEINTLSTTRDTLKDEVKELTEDAEKKKTFINKFVDWFGQYNNFILSIFNWMQRKGYMEVVSKEQTIKIQEALKADLEQSQNLSKGIQR